MSETEAVTPIHLRTYASGMSQAGRRPSTVLTHLRTLRTWFRRLTAEGEIPADPIVRAPTPKLDRER